MWIKKIRKRKLQSVLIILIVMVCAMLMTSSLVIMTSWQEPYDEVVKECESPVVKLYLYQTDEESANEIAEKFKSLEGIQAAKAIEYSNLTEKVKVKSQTTEAMMDYFFYLTVYNSQLHSKIRILEGDLSKLRSDGCLIPAVVANNMNINVGDYITIGDKRTLLVQGIYTDPYNMSISFETEIIVSEMPTGIDHKYYVSVFANHGLTGFDVIENYRLQNDGILEGNGITLEDRIANNQITDRILGGILLAMSFLILLVSGVMIRYMVKSMLLSDNKTIAVYKTIGYQNNVIIGIYLKFCIGLVFIGGVLGAALSSLVSNAFTSVTFQNLGVTSSSGILAAGAFCVIMIVLFVMLCVYLVVRKTKTIRPMEVFSRNSTTKSKKYKVGKRATNFSPLGMALRMICRDKKNTIIIIFTCIMSAYCVNFAATAFPMIQGMQEKNYYYIGFDQHDVSMESLSEDSFDEVISTLNSMEEVRRVIPTSTDEGLSLVWEPGMGDTILSIMLYDSFENIEMSVLEGSNPKYSNEIAIGNAVATRLNKHVGDYLDVYFQGDQKVSLLICGTFQSFFSMGNSCRLLGSTLYKNGIDFSYSEASIYLNEGYSEEEFILKGNLQFEQQAKFLDRSLKYENIMNMVTGPQIQAIGPFMVLALLLGGLNIIAIIYLKNKDARKIYSTYKAIGYSSNHLMRANLYYVGLIALASILVTVPMFILTFPKIMVIAMSFLGFKEYTVTYDVTVVIASNIGAVAVYLVSGLVSSKSLYENPIQDLTCE